MSANDDTTAKVVDTRHAHKAWTLPTTANGTIETWGAVEIAVLMDIRDHLKAIRAVLECHNAQAIPDLIRTVERNTRKPKKAKVSP